MAKLRLGHWEGHGLAGLSAEAEDLEVVHHRLLADHYERRLRIVEQPRDEYPAEDLYWGIAMVFNHPATDYSIWEGDSRGGGSHELKTLLERLSPTCGTATGNH